jgi:hypothetical protein
MGTPSETWRLQPRNLIDQDHASSEQDGDGNPRQDGRPGDPCRRPLTGVRTKRRNGVVRQDGRWRGSASPALFKRPPRDPRAPAAATSRGTRIPQAGAAIHQSSSSEPWAAGVKSSFLDAEKARRFGNTNGYFQARSPSLSAGARTGTASSRPWSDGLKLTVDRCEPGPRTPRGFGQRSGTQLWRVQAISRRRPSSAASRSTRSRLRSAHRPDARSSPRLRTARCSGSGPTLAQTDIPRRT